MREEMRLTTIQSGSKVFIDSNIFTYHLSGHSVFGETCREILKNVERGEYESYVNDVVLSEVLLNFIKSELFRLKGIKPHRVVREIKRDSSLIAPVNFDVVTGTIYYNNEVYESGTIPPNSTIDTYQYVKGVPVGNISLYELYINRSGHDIYPFVYKNS